MIDWVHLRGKEWGRWQTREVTGWPRKSLLCRIRDEGSVGAAIKQHAQPIPVASMPRAILAFHRAWLALEERHRQVVAVVYLTAVGRDAKAALLGLSRSAMYATLDAAHVRLAAAIEDDSDRLGAAAMSGLSAMSGRNVV